MIVVYCGMEWQCKNANIITDRVLLERDCYSADLIGSNLLMSNKYGTLHLRSKEMRSLWEKGL